MSSRVPALLSASLAVVVLVLSNARPAHAIARGDTAPAGSYPFSARLTMQGIPTTDGGVRDSWCSGALVAARWVITAGHCFRNAAGVPVDRPVARTTTVTVGPHSATVVAVHQSPENDVALAELDGDIDDIAPLAIARGKPTVGETVRLTGYGVTTEDGPPPARLQTGTFAITGIGKGSADVSGRTPHKDTSPCLHDSGGPYFRERPGHAPELVAVVSRGPTCPHTGPDEAARADVIADWLTATINGRTTALLTRTGMSATGVLVVLLVLVAVAVRRSPRTRRAKAIGRTAGRPPE